MGSWTCDVGRGRNTQHKASCCHSCVQVGRRDGQQGAARLQGQPAPWLPSSACSGDMLGAASPVPTKVPGIPLEQGHTCSTSPGPSPSPSEPPLPRGRSARSVARGPQALERPGRKPRLRKLRSRRRGPRHGAHLPSCPGQPQAPRGREGPEARPGKRRASPSAYKMLAHLAL